LPTPEMPNGAECKNRCRPRDRMYAL